MKYLFTLIIITSTLFSQGINPLIWYPVEEDNRFIQQAWGQVCNGTGILNSDTDNCNIQWGQHQLEIDIDNDGDNDFIAKVYEDWHTGFQGLGVFKNVYNEDSDNVFILDSIYTQCGSHGGISAGYFNNDEFIDIYFSTGSYHGPDWMLPDLDCIEQDFFYLGTSTGEFLQDTLDSSLPTQESFWIEGFRQDVFDVNNDGVDEILASYYFTNTGETNIAILSYNEDIQNFDTLDIINPLPQFSESKVFEWKTADLNGDGWNDMIVSTLLENQDSVTIDIFAYLGNDNGINFDSSIHIISIPALYGVLTMVGDEESLTPLDYDSNGDDEILMWNAFYDNNIDYATIPIDSLPQAELRLYDFMGDTLIDITDDAFFEGDNKDFNSPGNGVFIKDLNNDGVDDILFSTTWCLEKVNISGVDPGPPGSMSDNECASFALNLDGKFHLYEVEPTGAGHEEQTIQLFSIELDNYENDLVIYLDFYDQTYDCSAGNDLSNPGWFPINWPAQIWHYSIPNLSLVENNSLPNKFILHQNYPNPFNPVTSLRYDLPENNLVNITIYDMLGRKVKTLINQTQDAGYKSIIWNTTDDYGKPVSAGIYLYQIQAGEYISTKKMVLLK